MDTEALVHGQLYRVKRDTPVEGMDYATLFDKGLYLYVRLVFGPHKQEGLRDFTTQDDHGCSLGPISGPPANLDLNAEDVKLITDKPFWEQYTEHLDGYGANLTFAQWRKQVYGKP